MKKLYPLLLMLCFIHNFIYAQHNDEATKRMMARLDRYEELTTVATAEIKAYIQQGADVHARDAAGMTPLHLVIAVGDYDFELSKLLLKKGADINAQDNSGRTPLLVAIGNENYQAAEFLLKRGADPNIKANNGMAALMYWDYYHNFSPEFIKLLISHGADINAKDLKGNTPIFQAVATWDDRMVMWLIKRKADINAQNNKGETVLMAAMKYSFGSYDIKKYLAAHSNLKLKDTASRTIIFYAGDLDWMQILKDNGADFQDTDKYGRTAIFSTSILRLPFYVKMGVDINSKDHNGNTLLMVHAAQAGYLNTNYIRNILAAGAAVNARNKDGNTALHLASRIAMRDKIIDLIKGGADINIKNNAGQTPYDIAADDKTREMLTMLGGRPGQGSHADDGTGFTSLHRLAIIANHVSTDSAARLINSGMDINASDAYGNTPLHIAILVKNYGYYEMLMSKKADLHARNNKGTTPLMMLAYWGVASYDQMEKLLWADTDPDAQDTDGNTALHLAIKNDGYELGELTRDGKVKSLSIKNKAGQNTLHLAAQNKNGYRITEDLLGYGADINAKDSAGNTPLHLAAKSGYLANVQILIENCAAVNEENNAGLTPLNLATTPEIRKLLLANGALPAIRLNH